MVFLVWYDDGWYISEGLVNVFPAFIAALLACGSLLVGTEWQAFVGSFYYPDLSVIPIGIPSYTEGEPISTSTAPISIAITPDGTKVLTANAIGGDIAVLDLTASPIAAYTVSIPFALTVLSVAITPDGTRALVGYQSTQAPSETNCFVTFLDLTVTPITVSPSAIALPSVGTGMAITPDGTMALIGASDRNNPVISVLDLTTTPISVLSNFVTGVFSGGVAITPDGTKALAAMTSLSTVTILDLTAKPCPAQILTLGVGQQPFDVAITPDGTKALVTCLGGGSVLSPPGITVLDLTTTPISVQTPLLPLSQAPSFLAITPDSSKAMVSVGGAAQAGPIRLSASGPGEVVAFDLTTVPISEIATSPFYMEVPLAIAITPDQAPTARFTVRCHGKKATFDASASSSPVGSIQKYRWHFGDGGKMTTTSPIVEHTYHSLYREDSGKSVVAKLTVTNTAGTSKRITFTGRTVSNHGGPSAVCKHSVVRHSRGVRHQAAKRGPLSPPALLTAAQ